MLAATGGTSALEPNALAGQETAPCAARALLHAPQYLFLDEATACLDEASEAALYRLIEDKLLGQPPLSRSAIARRLKPSNTATSC